LRKSTTGPNTVARLRGREGAFQKGNLPKKKRAFGRIALTSVIPDLAEIGGAESQ